MQPTFIFLDFGGTLARQLNSREEAIAASLAMLGRAAPLADISRALAAAAENSETDSPHGMTLPQRYEFFITKYSLVARELGFADDARRIGEHLWETQRDTYQLYPDVRPALTQLRAGARLGIISNWDKLDLTQVCQELDIASWFDVILPSAQAEADKPDPRIFHFALSLAGESPESCVHIGDSFGADVEGARGVGITGILVARGGDLALDCPTVRRLDEVPALLARL